MSGVPGTVAEALDGTTGAKGARTGAGAGAEAGAGAGAGVGAGTILRARTGAGVEAGTIVRAGAAAVAPEHVSLMLGEDGTPAGDKQELLWLSDVEYEGSHSCNGSDDTYSEYSDDYTEYSDSEGSEGSKGTPKGPVAHAEKGGGGGVEGAADKGLTDRLAEDASAKVLSPKVTSLSKYSADCGEALLLLQQERLGLKMQLQVHRLVVRNCLSTIHKYCLITSASLCFPGRKLCLGLIRMK